MKILRLLATLAGLLSVSSVAAPAFAVDAGTDASTAAEGGAVRDASSLDSGDGAISRSDAGPLAPPTHVVGAHCKKDIDCASGLTCLTTTTDSLGAGGPAGGLCTVSCTTSGQNDCNAVDTGSICAAASTGTLRYCAESCEFGTLEGGATKCHDRDDMACAPLQTAAGGFCSPTCRGDFDCQGRACDPRSGLCTTSVAGTLPLGTACDPSVEATNCLGVCTTLGASNPSPDNSFCTTKCTIGRTGACGQDPSMSGPITAGCVFSFDSSEGIGDVGECGQLCDCDSDCTNPGFICNAATTKLSGRAGSCVPKLTFNGVTPGLPCAARVDAGAGADADAGTRTDAGSEKPTPISATGGCSCRTGASESPARASTALALLIGALGLRRRSNKKST